MSPQDRIIQNDKNEPRSLFEKVLAELAANGKIITLTPEENFEIRQQLNQGMDEFSQNEKIRSAQTLLEARHILLD